MRNLMHTPNRRLVITTLALCAALASTPAGAKDTVPSVIPYSGFLELPNNAMSVNIEVRLQREELPNVWTTVVRATCGGSTE